MNRKELPKMDPLYTFYISGKSKGRHFWCLWCLCGPQALHLTCNKAPILQIFQEMESEHFYKVSYKVHLQFVKKYHHCTLSAKRLFVVHLYVKEMLCQLSRKEILWNKTFIMQHLTYVANATLSYLSCQWLFKKILELLCYALYQI